MTRTRWFSMVLPALVIAGVGSAGAQWVITDPATTARTAATAALKDQIIQTVTAQYETLYRMARRLSAVTTLDRYAATEPPRWRTHDFETFLYANDYHAALNYGDPTGIAYERVVRTRRSALEGLARLSPTAREVVMRSLATLDAADSAAIAATHQAGALRYNGRREMQAIDALQAQVVDSAAEQSTTAVLDKISGASLIEVRQKQARVQLLAGIVEQLLVDNRRARDTEAAILNMQLGRMRAYDDEGWGFISGAADDLRTWRQP